MESEFRVAGTDKGPITATEPEPELPPEGQPPAIPDPAPSIGGRSDLFPTRGERRTGYVLLPTLGKRFQIVAVRPGEIAWVNEQCIIRKPDPDHDGEEVAEWQGTRYGFLLCAIALRDEKGRAMFAGTLTDPTLWVYGAEKIAQEMEIEDYTALQMGVLGLAGLNKKARAAAGKGSGRTPTTD